MPDFHFCFFGCRIFPLNFNKWGVSSASKRETMKWIKRFCLFMPPYMRLHVAASSMFGKRIRLNVPFRNEMFPFSEQSMPLTTRIWWTINEKIIYAARQGDQQICALYRRTLLVLCRIQNVLGNSFRMRSLIKMRGLENNENIYWGGHRWNQDSNIKWRSGENNISHNTSPFDRALWLY